MSIIMFNIILTFDFSSLFIWLVVIIIGIVVLLIVFRIVRFIKKTFRQKELWGLDKEEIKKRWKEIESLLDKKNEMSFKLAILEADKLLDYTLKHMGFGGSSLGQRLKLACYKFTRLHQVWPAHRTRNQLVHEPNYRLNYWRTKKVIKIFKKGLEELEVL